MAFTIFCSDNGCCREIPGHSIGYRVEESTTPLMQQVRYLDKLVIELAAVRLLPNSQHTCCFTGEKC